MKYAYIDEFGAFGFQFDKDNCSSHFIICAIIVEEELAGQLEIQLETIRKTYFQAGEIKSSKVGTKHKRRKKILDKLMELPFKVQLFVVDKRKIYENSGLRYKESFYKYLTNQLYEELRVYFKELIIIADEIGNNEFKQIFTLIQRRNKRLQETYFLRNQMSQI